MIIVSLLSLFRRQLRNFNFLHRNGKWGSSQINHASLSSSIACNIPHTVYTLTENNKHNT